VRVSLRERKVIDVDGIIVTLEFTLDIPEDKAWYQCFVQALGPPRSGSSLFVDTNPQFSSAETLTWKIEMDDIPQAAHYLAERVHEANQYFVELLERQEQIRRQLEEAGRRRREAINDAQRLLDESWPTPDLHNLHASQVEAVAGEADADEATTAGALPSYDVENAH
jgi:hypothetical protein